MDPGVPGPFTSKTEGPGKNCQGSSTELATGASASNPDAAGLKGASEMIPGSSVELDMGERTEKTLSFDVGLDAQPTQPPHPQLGTSTSEISNTVVVSVSNATTGA